jgi:hypothetical protein
MKKNKPTNAQKYLLHSQGPNVEDFFFKKVIILNYLPLTCFHVF